MTVNTNRGTRALAHRNALAVGLAVGLAGVLATSSVANATDAAPGTIDTSVTDGTITIHKHETAGATASGDPSTGVITDGGAPIAGAGFTAWPIVSLDLTDPADWDGLSDLITAVSAGGVCEVPGETLGTPTVEQLTNASGELSVTNLSVGAYLMCETTLPAGAVSGASPFIVTLPTPYQGEWIYDVHAFPKNTLNVVEKSVDTQVGFGLGSTVKFPVTTVIKPLAEAQSYTSFTMSDTLDSRLGNPSVESVKIDGVDVAFTRGGAGNTISASIDPSIINTNLNKTIEVVFSGVVESVGTGTIENTATLFVNDPSLENGGIPSNTVSTQWGDLVISKVDADSTTTGLSGATFEVYPSSDPYATDCAATTPGTDPIQIEGMTQFTTGNDGRAAVAGLFVTDSSNTPNESAAERCYFVKETQAPIGFVTPTGADAFTAVEVDAGETATVDLIVENTKQSVPNLPLTGGAGQTALVMGGLALAGSGIALASVRRRKVSA